MRKLRFTEATLDWCPKPIALCYPLVFLKGVLFKLFSSFIFNDKTCIYGSSCAYMPNFQMYKNLFFLNLHSVFSFFLQFSSEVKRKFLGISFKNKKNFHKGNCRPDLGIYIYEVTKSSGV